jgi:hypothetical protein
MNGLEEYVKVKESSLEKVVGRKKCRSAGETTVCWRNFQESKRERSDSFGGVR